MDSVRTILTRLYARVFLGGLCDSGTYRVQGIEQTVHWIDRDDGQAGWHAPWGAIVLNRQELQDKSDNLTDFTFLHEVGHGRMPLPLRLVFTPLRWVTTVLLLLLPVIAPILLMGVYPFSGRDIVNVAVAYLILSTIVVGAYVLIAWIDEGYAELFVLSEIGEAQYRDCHQEVRQRRDSGLLRRIRLRLTYPRPEAVLWVHDRLR